MCTERALQNASGAGEVLNPRGATDALDAVVRALRTRGARDTAAMVDACADGPAITPHDARNCMIGLTVLGELDAAFALAMHICRSTWELSVCDRAALA